MDMVVNKRDLLIEAAIELFGEFGFWNTSTASVAKKAGVATGTLFNHFKTKDELIDEVMVYLKREMINEAKRGLKVDADLRDQFEHIWYSGMAWGERHPERFRLMEQIQVSQLLSNKEQKGEVGLPLDGLRELIQHGIDAGALQPLCPDLIAEIMYRNAQSYFEFLQARPEMSRFEKNAHLQAGFEMCWKSLSREPSA